ncbi:transcriptional regulator, TetR family [Rhodococcus aetherivorans]|uniref:TetR/AcrR family transcriptional regulator n=1 Tax=Rhodococcus aetherivorans TaxID=191292 RepID=A0AA46PJL5_9NOCA|nr:MULTISPECIES: TetR/AcrR family transcriptional regulator [Rhodococcus]ETT27105.1 transcriptional regulator, TetR family [Rhodococcus rhodochrous ATCC 21198]ANZ23854.1 TetR family transcriptional regulator [Rhodococcus sp. WB1]MDV6293994.1 TetR/AcrR family transcriptional regulator [Rhodococcus aetherivorans]NGP28391.1 TetR/AcrR family transcriptional regulator [Rhodococcus aetherivorans]PND53426.1 TetR/AcrR family transcriptional regulator [Rhodococcus sp. ENV425]
MDPHERRRQILDRSAQLFATKGIAATTIREIADEVGVYSGALYHYFPSKEAIVTELIREYIEDLSARCREITSRTLPPVERIEALVLLALTTSENYRGATTIWQREGEYMRDRLVEADLAEIADEVEKAWREAITEGVAGGIFRDDIDPEVFYQLIRDAVWQAPRWHRPSAQRSNADLARDITRIFVDGFRPRTG